MKKNIPVIILAGGKGERLRPLTDRLPKPMALVNKRPLLEYIVKSFVKSGLTNIIISVCYLPNKIVRHFGNGKRFNANISYIFEKKDKPLGTAGAIGKLREKINGTIIVCYGDTLRTVDIKEMIHFHKQKKGIASLFIYENKSANPKSLVEINHNQRITSFIERPRTTSSPLVWSNGGLYIFEQKIFSYIPKNKPSDFAKDIFPSLFTQEKIYAYIQPGYFLDIGTVDKLQKANNDMIGRVIV